MKKAKIKTFRKKPSLRQKQTVLNMVENGGNVSKAMRDAGFSDAYSKNPQKVTASKAFKELAEEYLPDTDLLHIHKRILAAHKLDHMIFPLGPKSPDETEEEVEDESDQNVFEAERTNLTDDDISVMLKDVGCLVRKIVHVQQARHVYFWSPDNKARTNALELAYKIRGKIKPDTNNLLMPVQINVSEDREKYS